MIRHIVAWKLNDSENKTEIANTMKKELEALKAKIEEIVDIEVGINFNQTENASDIILVSTFKSKEDLATYIDHPDHKYVGASFVRPNVSERRVVDYEF